MVHYLSLRIEDHATEEVTGSLDKAEIAGWWLESDYTLTVG